VALLIKSSGKIRKFKRESEGYKEASQKLNNLKAAFLEKTQLLIMP
jgi:hypothetical protein